MSERSATEKDALIRSVLPEIARYARRYKRQWPRLDYDEFHSAGSEGARRAAELWKPGGASFASYAKHGINGRMQDYVQKATGSFDARMRAAHAALEQRGASTAEVAGDTSDASPSEARKALVAACRADVFAMARVSLLLAPPPDPEALMIEREESVRVCAALKEALAELEPNQRAAVEKFRLQGKTYKAIAEELETSEKTVQRLVGRAEDRMMDVFAAAGITELPAMP